MRYNMKQCILVIFMWLIYLPLISQSREGARMQMNRGNYSNAVTILTALDELYSGQYTSDLSIAKKCLSLQRTAKVKYKAQHYTEAESLYNQILKLNPNDRNARQVIAQCQEERRKFWAVEYSKCKTISDYRAFVQRYPNAPQVHTAIAKVEEYDLIRQDNNAWTIADREGTVSSYTAYILKSNPKSTHMGEAYRNRARLHYRNAVYAKNDDYQYSCYSSAKNDYENAKKYGALLPEDSNKYIVCLAEEKYHELIVSSVSSITMYISWASSYKLNRFVSSHLHLDKAYSMLVDAYCKSGRFDEARNVVEQCYGQMTSSYFTMSSSKEWDKSDWKAFIKKQEKQQIKNQSKGIPMPWSLGVNLSFVADDKYLGLAASLSIGDFSNRLNWELSVSPIFRINKKDSYNYGYCPITTGPRFNILKSNQGGYFLSFVPEFGYCVSAGRVYGAKLLLGYGSLGMGIDILRNMDASSVYTPNRMPVSNFGLFTINYYF